jgi:SAM-dependent methyltransferase
MWYCDWFNSPYYHLLYKHRDEKEAEHFIDNLIRHFKIKPGSRILDMPCGKGRHAVYLEKKGFDVTGADLAENSIRIAKNSENKNLRFLVHNMLDPFPGREYDAVMNLFTSFGYFETEEEDLRALSNMKDCLKKNGLLIIDFLNAAEIQKNIKPREIITIDDTEFTILKEIRNGFIYKTVEFSAEKQTMRFCEKVRLLGLKDFQTLLFATGLQIIDTFGNYSLEPFSEENSERLIIAAVNA